MIFGSDACNFATEELRVYAKPHSDARLIDENKAINTILSALEALETGQKGS